MRIRAAVTTPWARAGEEFDVDTPTAPMLHHLGTGVLELVDEPVLEKEEEEEEEISSTLLAPTEGEE